MKKYGSYITIYFKGMAMGTADVIPGVSGGTLALILGIYERLIKAVKSVNTNTLKGILALLTFWKADSRKLALKEFKNIDGLFLIVLVFGIISAAVIASSIIPALMINHTEKTFAVFLGLIIPSIAIPWLMIKEKSIANFIPLLLGLAFTIFCSYLLKENGGLIGNDFSFGATALIIFLCAMIAISAMILPGISGSYILMLLGQYIFVTGLIAKLKLDLLKKEPSSEAKQQAIDLVAHFSTIETMALIGIFIAGCAVGVTLFSRVIHWSLEHLHDKTMAFLTGMIASSVYVLWPYKATPTDPDILVLGKGKWLPMAENLKIDFSNQVHQQSLIFFAVALTLSTTLIIIGRKLEKKKTA